MRGLTDADYQAIIHKLKNGTRVLSRDEGAAALEYIIDLRKKVRKAEREAGDALQLKLFGDAKPGAARKGGR